MTKCTAILSAALAAGLAAAQTQVNLQNQSRAVDFSAAPATKPAQTGNTLPTTCSPGAFFVLMSNPAGQNIFVCTSTNTWTLQSGSGGSSLNLMAVSATGTTLNIGTNCSALQPCNVRIGATVYAFTAPMTATLTAGTGAAYVYVASNGTLTVGHNLTLTCAGGCLAQSGITGFPTDSYPLAMWTATSGLWSPTGTDARAVAGRDLVAPGVGVTTASSGGSTAVSAPPQEGGFSVAFRGTDVAAGQTVFLTVPYACTITDWAVTSDGAATIMLWRVPDGGTSLPTSGNSLNTNGLALTTGTRIHSTNLSDLSTTAIYAFDTFGVNLFSVASASHVEFYLGCAR